MEHMEHSMEHCAKKAKFMKCFFLKSFVVSIIILLLSWLISIMFFKNFTSMVDNSYGISANDFAEICILVYAAWKILIIQFTLVPFIVACLIEKHIRKELLHEELRRKKCGE